ncbi:putrescine transport system ATP-binding protein/mannopine transport system ATP-binding protein [Dongia mobilis]|uniref:Putrescine transport system ATP-binding protein/mannopine transport system ATP-binding protein n=1 Tax=Dongia mobilis TaxID=578943 RepID=A0A4R6WK34_9PROT|nr:ABC transporter ATP-binding protein [Dongia mobilis]TDQ78427.1 putrescine transport system ATP-binding protein/mannopine transport system ATP-binding protein [Dongia mobilis]
MSATISLQNLRKTFGDGQSGHLAVDDVSLEIAAGQFVSLLGSSGCGKTTTLRIVAGLESPTSGRVLFDGADITHLPASHRDMRMMFQDLALFPHMSVEENVAFGLRLKRMRGKLSADEIRRRVATYLDIVRLGEMRKRMPHQLSGGQRQRVALARALATEPPVVLFDEPLGALDASLRRSTQAELKRIHRELGKTFIYVTHDQDEALSMSDMVAVMSGGRLIQYDTPEGIYERPRTRFVAQFIGAKNLISARVEKVTGSEVLLRLADGTHLGAHAEESLVPGQEVTAVFRADRALMQVNGYTDASLVSGIHVQSMFLGNRMEHIVRLVDGSEVTIHDAQARPLPGDGGPLQFALRPQHVQILTK